MAPGPHFGHVWFNPNKKTELATTTKEALEYSLKAHVPAPSEDMRSEFVNTSTPIAPEQLRTQGPLIAPGPGLARLAPRGTCSRSSSSTSAHAQTDGALGHSEQRARHAARIKTSCPRGDASVTLR